MWFLRMPQLCCKALGRLANLCRILWVGRMFVRVLWRNCIRVTCWLCPRCRLSQFVLVFCCWCVICLWWRVLLFGVARYQQWMSLFLWCWGVVGCICGVSEGLLLLFCCVGLMCRSPPSHHCGFRSFQGGSCVLDIFALFFWWSGRHRCGNSFRRLSLWWQKGRWRLLWGSWSWWFCRSLCPVLLCWSSFFAFGKMYAYGSLLFQSKPHLYFLVRCVGRVLCSALSSSGGVGCSLNTSPSWKNVVGKFGIEEWTIDVELCGFVVFAVDDHSLGSLVETGNFAEIAGCVGHALKMIVLLVPLLLHAVRPSSC